MTESDQEHRLTQGERLELLLTIKQSLPPLGALLIDETFRFREVTGFLERVLRDWCEVAGPEVRATRQ